MTVTCEECGEKFKTKQALASHRSYVHGLDAPGPKRLPKVTEEDVANMLDFFQLIEEGNSPIEACLGLQINPQNADRWSRIYKRLAIRGGGGNKELLETLKELVDRMKKVEEFVVMEHNSRKSLEKTLARAIVEQAYEAMQEHEKKHHKPFMLF